jgi:hypothetical protein
MKRAALSRIETGFGMLSATINERRPRPEPVDADARPDDAEAARECRALVAVRPAAAASRPARRAAAPFLAQLIAVKDQHPQTRERRRAEPREALAAYASAAALTRS